MGVVHLIRCERFEDCAQEFLFDPQDRGMVSMPSHWLLLYKGSPNLHEGMNFCSKECLWAWLEDIRLRGWPGE